MRTLNKIDQLPELTASASDQNIDIICIQEHRYIHSEDIKYPDSGNGSTLVSVSAGKKKNTCNAEIGSVGMLTVPWALKSLNSIEKLQPRLMVATFNGNTSTAIIYCYSLTYVNEESDLIPFYDELSSLVRIIPKHYVLVIVGGMNAQSGKKVKPQIQIK